MKSPDHWAAFSRSAVGPRGCESEWAGLALASHLTSKGYRSNMKEEKRGNEPRARQKWASPSQRVSSVCVYLQVFLGVCYVCASCHVQPHAAPTSPGGVVVGHSVCGLDGGEVRLQGKQLTGQVWHTAERKMENAFHIPFLWNWKLY